MRLIEPGWEKGVIMVERRGKQAAKNFASFFRKSRAKAKAKNVKQISQTKPRMRKNEKEKKRGGRKSKQIFGKESGEGREGEDDPVPARYARSTHSGTLRGRKKNTHMREWVPHSEGLIYGREERE